MKYEIGTSYNSHNVLQSGSSINRHVHQIVWFARHCVLIKYWCRVKRLRALQETDTDRGHVYSSTWRLLLPMIQMGTVTNADRRLLQTGGW